MSHTPRPLEYCFVCGQSTGNAGQGDGSLYCECDKGPFCDECWNNHHSADTKVADLLEALERAQQVINFTDVENWWIDIAMPAIAKAKEPNT